MLRSERFWVLVLAVTAFLAGAAGGLVVGRHTVRPVEPGPFTAFEERFARAFDLDSVQRRDLRYILDRYHSDVEAVEARQVADLEDDLAQCGATCRDRIRRWVLHAADRERFDHMVAGDEVATTLPAR